MQSLSKRRRARFLRSAALGFGAGVFLVAGFAHVAQAAGQTVWMAQTIAPPVPTSAPSPASAPVPVTSVGAFGAAVVVADGTAFVGAPLTRIAGHTQQGAVYVYREAAHHTWEKSAVLAAADGAAYDQFGAALAVSGSTLVVGAPGAAVGGDPFQGAAYVFERSGGTWSQAQKLAASDGAAHDEFGAAVALDAGRLLVGAPFAAVGGQSRQGAVYAFAHAGTGWSQVQKLVAGDGAANDSFGTAIALQDSRALIGASGATVGGSALRGAVYAFAHSTSGWSQSQKLVAADGLGGDLFGASLALDGNRALVGAPHATVAGRINQGKVYSYTLSGASWSPSGAIVAEEGGAEDQFGAALALAGSHALIGVGGEEGGSRLFVAQAGEWTGRFTFDAGAGAGGAVGLADRLVLIGAPGGSHGKVVSYRKGRLSLDINAPSDVKAGEKLALNVILTNTAATSTPPLTLSMSSLAGIAPGSGSGVSPQGSCDVRIKTVTIHVTCGVGSVAGNGGTARAHIEYRISKSAASLTVIEAARVTNVVPSLTASAKTRIHAAPQKQKKSGGGGLALGLLAGLGLLAACALLRRRR